MALAVVAVGARGQSGSAPPIAPFSAATNDAPPPPWRVVTLPKQPNHSRYRIERVDGTPVLRMDTDGG
ncbi:MAG: hypothetical protein MUC68_15370, partial [Burkholderiaceae bacterium]|nr:hypothetical protein [Burkholderiaceae bacterium]